MKLPIAHKEPHRLDELEAHLAPLGHEVVRVVGRDAAVKAIDEGRIDAVLLDVMMPNFEGTRMRATLTCLGPWPIGPPWTRVTRASIPKGTV